MKRISIFIISLVFSLGLAAQTTLTEAVDFNVKTVEGVVIDLFPLLDGQNKIVVIDFFTTS